MFTNGMQETTGNTVAIPDVEAEVMKKFLEFIYTLKFDGLEKYSAELLAVADKVGHFLNTSLTFFMILVYILHSVS